MLETFSQLKIAVRDIMMMMTRCSLMYHLLFTPILPEQALLTDERTDILL